MQLALNTVFGVRPRFSHVGNKGMKALPVSLLKTNPRKYGHSGDFATNHLDEQEPATSSLHLLQICQ